MTIQFHSILQKGINMKQKTSLFTVIKIILCSIAGILVIYSCVQSEEDSEIINTDTNTALIKSESQNKPSKEELYLEARQLLDSKQYDEALAIYDSLGAYKDSMYHAEGIRCMDYATNLAFELSYSNATLGIVGGMEMYYEYSPENYTFTSVFEVPKDGLFGILAGLGVAMGEETNYNQNELKKMAEELYYEHFAIPGYYYIKCAYEVRDHATGNYHLETFTPTEDIPDAISEFYSFHEAVDSYFGIERVKLYTWDSYDPQNIDIMTYINTEYHQAPLDTPLTLEECKELIYKLSGYFWSIDSTNPGERAVLSITEEFFDDINDIQYTYKILGAYKTNDEYIFYLIFDEAPEYLCMLYFNTSFEKELHPDLNISIPIKDGNSTTFIFDGLKL